MDKRRREVYTDKQTSDLKCGRQGHSLSRSLPALHSRTRQTLVTCTILHVYRYQYNYTVYLVEDTMIRQVCKEMCRQRSLPVHTGPLIMTILFLEIPNKKTFEALQICDLSVLVTHQTCNFNKWCIIHSYITYQGKFIHIFAKIMIHHCSKGGNFHEPFAIICWIYLCI